MCFAEPSVFWAGSQIDVSVKVVMYAFHGRQAGVCYMCGGLKVDCTSYPDIWFSKSFVVLVFSTRRDTGMPYCRFPHHIIPVYLHRDAVSILYDVCCSDDFTGSTC